MSLMDKDGLDQKIKFAVNLDIGNFKEQLKELHDKVPADVYCNRGNDLQGLLRKHIPGMSVPQIYLKVAGCWTGGHQENLSLRAVNINHGPGEVEWFCMEADEAYRFNDHILADKNLNLLQSEGLWYISLEEVLQRGFKVSKFVQEQGDVVILAPGTLHWVRSYSMTVNSAWNLCEYNHEQVLAMFRRYEFNLKYGFRNLIPLQTLTLDIMNNAANKLDEQGFEEMKRRLMGFLEKGIKVIEEVYARHKEFENDNLQMNNIVMCSSCFGETFEVWFYANSNKTAKFDTENIICH